MATIFNTGLRRKIGMEFEYKISLQEFLTEAIGSPLVSSYSSGPNTAQARQDNRDYFVKCGPTMGFEAKKFAYITLEYVVQALLANANVPAADKTAINGLLLSVIPHMKTGITIDVDRYAGLEGDGDFHFMVATFNLAEGISKIIAEVVPAPQAPVGTISTLELVDDGSGYTDGTDGNGTISVTFRSTETNNPAGYTQGTGTVTISAGKIITIDSIATGGVGFKDDQIVSIDPVAPATNGGTLGMAIVTSVA